MGSKMLFGGVNQLFCTCTASGHHSRPSPLYLKDNQI